MRPRRVFSQEDRRDQLLRRSELSLLVQLPSWEVYGGVIQEEIERIKRSMMGRMMGVGMSLEQQAYERGRIMGLKAARSIPEHANRDELTESSPTNEEVAAGE